MDFAGQTVPVSDTASGGRREATCLWRWWACASYTYAERPGAKPRRLDRRARHACNHAGGVPGLLVRNNPRALIWKPTVYEPNAQPHLPALAEHYGCAILPARPYKPRDKAKVEAGRAAGRALDSRAAAPPALPESAGA